MIDRSLRILFVEDNPGDIRLVREMLIAADEERIELSFVSRVGEVRTRLAQGGIDVILLDLNLPDANGLSAVEHIHADFPEIPLVVLSSVIDEELAVASLQAGAQDFLVKGMINGPLLTRSIFYAIKRKDLEDQLLFSLHHDSLTGLYNRKFLIAELEREIRRSQSSGGKFAVLLLDLSRFKSINDTYGHGVGDSLLIEVARILSGMLDPGMILARMGGDEFGFLLPAPGEGDDVGRFARRIRQELGVGLDVGEKLAPVHLGKIEVEQDDVGTGRMFMRGLPAEKGQGAHPVSQHAQVVPDLAVLERLLREPHISRIVLHQQKLHRASHFLDSCHERSFLL